MTRKLSVLLVLAFFVMSLGSLALAANAKTATQSKIPVGDVAAQKIFRPYDDNDGSGATMSGKPSTSWPSALGYYMAGQVQVGSTEFDYQSNTRQQRQVAMGTDNRVHTIWINREYGLDPTGPRSIYYSGFLLGGPVVSPWYISPIPGSGGYGSISITPGDSLAIATYHYTKPAPATDTRPRVQIGRQLGILSTAFLMFDYPNADNLMANIPNCQGIKTGSYPGDTKEGGYIWPSIAADFDGTNSIAHVLAYESAELAADTQNIVSLVYYKTLPNAAVPTATCAFLLDSVTSGINYDIAASPVSNKVAAVYLSPKVWAGPNFSGNDDVYYKESSDLGANWGGRIRIHEFTNADSVLGSGGTSYYFERGGEVSALYTDDDCLHVLFLGTWTAPKSSYGLILPARLHHWNSCDPTCSEMLLDGYQTWGAANGLPPTNQRLISKINLTQCKVASGPDAGTRLYAVYTTYPDSSGITGNTHTDVSAGAILNGDCVVQGSTDITGALWGPVVNVSNTRSDNCAAGACFSEQFTNSALYVNDSLRIQYLVDKDAGSAAPGYDGVLTDNPVVIKSFPCYAITPEAVLAASLTSIEWPDIHTTPGAGPNHTANVPVILTNTGNTPALYTRTVAYASGSGWLSFAQPASGSVPAGCIQTLSETITATGPASQGLFKATVTWTYNPGGKIVTLPIELWNFTDWFMDENNSIRTSTVAMAVNQSSRVGSNRAGYAGFRYFADPATVSYVFDGSLVIGTSNADISTSLHAADAGVRGNGDTAIGRTFSLSAMTFDSTTFPGYRIASGIGCNRDSSIAFDASFYAPKFIDSTNFMIGKFSLYAGPKAPGATINNVAVAYGSDIDVPDSASTNLGGVDATLQMVYQTANWAPDDTRYMALSGWRDDATPIAGGMVLDNRNWLYPHNGYKHDSIWTRIQGTTDYQPYPRPAHLAQDTAKDLNSMLVFTKGTTITPAATGKFTVYVIFAGQPKTGGSLANLNSVIAKAKKFLCNNIAVGAPLCPSGCTACGDANSSGTINISDAVFLISYIFSPGAPAPADCNYANGMGDANGSGTVNISDAVYLISYIFSPGAPAPHCQGM